jgi:hypothetical protein
MSMHGGAKGSGAPKGNTYAVTHGQSTLEMKALRKFVRQIIKEAMELKDDLKL